jgi:hypothetical protein
MTWIISRAMMKAYENSPCSQGLVEEYWEENYSDGERFAPLNVMPTPHPFWLRDKTTDILSHSRFGAMSRRLTDGIGEDVLTWFQVGFRAKTSPQPEKAQGSEENEADCGERWLALSVKYDPGTHGWKTHHCLFPEDLDWSCLTLPKWGMLANGELWERTTQEPDTSAIGAGSGESWPTPKTRDWKDSMGASLDATNPDGSHRDRRDRLMGAIVDRQNWATPQARDHRTGGADRWENPERSRNLNDQVAHQHSFPTPKTNGFCSGSGAAGMVNQLAENGQIDEETRRSMRAGNGGQLNPDWVEWLMGWPVAWTRLENTYTNWMNWEVDPADIDLVPRIATDIPNRIDRLRAIGNGQVPQAMVLAWNELTTNKEKK